MTSVVTNGIPFVTNHIVVTDVSCGVECCVCTYPLKEETYYPITVVTQYTTPTDCMIFRYAGA